MASINIQIVKGVRLCRTPFYQVSKIMFFNKLLIYEQLKVRLRLPSNQRQSWLFDLVLTTRRRRGAEMLSQVFLAAD